jgi:hypothetical protein
MQDSLYNLSVQLQSHEGFRTVWQSVNGFALFSCFSKEHFASLKAIFEENYHFIKLHFVSWYDEFFCDEILRFPLEHQY